MRIGPRDNRFWSANAIPPSQWKLARSGLRQDRPLDGRNLFRFTSERRFIPAPGGENFSWKTGEIRQASSDLFFLDAVI